MLNFVYDNKTTLIFGKGTHHETGTLLKPLGKKILLHYGSGSIRRSGLYDAVTASLKAAGVEYEELGGVQANPTLPLVYEGIRLCREHGLGLVLAVIPPRRLRWAFPMKGTYGNYTFPKNSLSPTLCPSQPC